MDVVRTNVEKIGGTVDVHSKLGAGTTMKIKIPLTLAIIPALVVTSGGDRFAIPQVSLLELVRLEGEQARKGIESIHGASVYRLRGNLLPLVNLNSQLLLKDTGDEENDAVNIVVLQADDRQFGLIVEEINDTEEIVVKPLGAQLKGIDVFAGATIMGDGRVALILDVLGIAQHAGVVSEVHDRTLNDETSESASISEDLQNILLLGINRDGRLGVPLSLVARLEEFEHSVIETAGDQEVVQYRNEILPLIHLSQMLGSSNENTEVTDTDTPLQVVVYTEEGRSVGLVVDRILDIVEDTMSIQRKSSQSGILGSAVIQGKVTDLLDVHGLIRTVDPNFFEQPEPVTVGS